MKVGEKTGNGSLTKDETTWRVPLCLSGRRDWWACCRPCPLCKCDTGVYCRYGGRENFLCIIKEENTNVVIVLRWIGHMPTNPGLSYYVYTYDTTPYISILYNTIPYISIYSTLPNMFQVLVHIMLCCALLVLPCLHNVWTFFQKLLCPAVDCEQDSVKTFLAAALKFMDSLQAPHNFHQSNKIKQLPGFLPA